MWWRILTFCVLVTLVLFVVLSCIQDRPVVNLFFRRCCEDNIENDQLIFENFGGNFLKERLVGFDTVDNSSMVSKEDIEEFIEKLNVHNPGDRTRLELDTEREREMLDDDKEDILIDNETLKNEASDSTTESTISMYTDAENTTEVTKTTAVYKSVDVLG
ncbi:uncharacterized protein LOC131849972 [Achroia grisella]|uniref:uncharacterized protein LOC131840798 n=1 Tax=Achroia grisella TaxID=688607 RepID=UPI0027D211CC|nr:uncharacterized protein LOC131840798 [Achroia grisella]XP_059056094.1 uncharacterized protein LOC131849972 [Achroia grisella]